MPFQEFPVIPFRDVSGGQMSSVDVLMLPQNAAVLSLGFQYDQLGAAVTRGGYSRVGTTVSNGNACQGIAGFVNAAGTLGRQVAAFNGNSYAWNGSTWTNIGSHTSTTDRVRYAPFLDYVFRVGGGDVTKSWNGNVASSFGTNQLSGAPSGTLILPFKSKLLIGGNSSFPDRVYMSSVPDVNGNLTWTSTDYLDVNPNDSDNLTAFAKVGTTALLFKHNFIYRWNGTATDAEPMIDVGTISQEVVATVNGTVYFFSPKGVFSTDGGAPAIVSNPIRDVIEAIPATNYPNMNASGDENIYRLHCGTVTVGGRTFTNLALEYDVNLKVWGMTEMADAFTASAFVMSADNSQTVIGGTSTGKVENFDGSTTDDGTGIKFERTVRTYLNSMSDTKVINDITVYLTGSPAIFSAKTQAGKVYVFGSTSGPVSYIKSKELMFNGYVDLTISGVNSLAPAQWNGFEILRSRTLGSIN